MLTRHTDPTRGDCTIEGHSIRTHFQEAAQQMGVVTQDNTLYADLSCIDHLLLFGRVRLST